MVSYGQITDEGVARLRERIGIPVRNPAPPHYREPGVDAFRIVAQAYGDDNPLWGDRDYAARTRWREPIAPPSMVGGDTLIGEDDPVEIPVVVRRISQNSQHSRIVVRHAVEIRPRAPGDSRSDQRIAEKGAPGPLAAADEIG